MAMKERSSVHIPRVVVGVFFGLAALFPLAWMALSGFKLNSDVLATPFSFFPPSWHVENYVQILVDPDFSRAMMITFAGAAIFTIFSIAINSMAAYVFARLDFSFKRTLWVIVIGTMFIPNMAILLTSFIVVTKLHMLDTMLVLILPPLASAAQVFFIRQFYLNIPIALEEAALLDGAGRWRIFTRIFLPLSQPAFVVVGVTSFMAYWNSYVWPVMTITSPNLYVVGQYLANFRVSRGPELGLLMAGSMLAALPVIILVLIFQRKIIGNIKIAGLK
ncbi:carbohydrate ABC transporter permease [Humibacter ginsengiterrae]